LLPDIDHGGLILPDGFGAIVVVDSIGQSRHLAVNKNGDIYVKLRIATDSLGNLALRDVNKDGKADIIKRFGDYPNDGTFATEMRIHKGYLYFSSELVIYRQKLVEGQLIPKGKPEILVIDKYPIRWHNAKTLAFDNQDGMYVTFSAPTNVCEDWNTVPGESSENIKGHMPCFQLTDFGGIWKFSDEKQFQRQEDGKKYATGLRSIVGMSWNDFDNSLYAVLHGRDYLHNHAPKYYSDWDNAVLPAEEFLKINENDDFGWPYSYYDPFKSKRMLAPEYGGDGVKEATSYELPIMAFPAHWAPNDLLFYKGHMFPERYKNGAFIAFHGSTNRNPYPQGGYIVGFVPFKNGKPSGQLEVFADGFAGVDTIKVMADAKYRPMGLAEGPDGSLYISESRKGKIWRILFTGDRNKLTGFSTIQDGKNLSHLKTPDKVKDLLK
jgi:glucose/arabinose dehydrogenase